MNADTTAARQRGRWAPQKGMSDAEGTTSAVSRQTATADMAVSPAAPADPSSSVARHAASALPTSGLVVRALRLLANVRAAKASIEQLLADEQWPIDPPLLLALDRLQVLEAQARETIAKVIAAGHLTTHRASCSADRRLVGSD